jgi:hypothetical protein
MKTLPTEPFGFPGFELIADAGVRGDRIFMIPGDIVQLIRGAQDGLLDWDFVIEEATKAAREGRIGVITNIG